MELTIRELATAAATAVAAADVRGASRRVTDLPDERTIRWYSTIGLLDRPSGHRGRTALYGERHLLQLVAIKRRQSDGRTLADIQAELVGATDRTLRSIADLAAGPTASPPAPPATGTRAFWRERPDAARPEPARPEPARAAPAPADSLLAGVELGDGIVLLLPGRPNPSDVESIRAAAQPLLDLLAQRRLTRGSTS